MDLERAPSFTGPEGEVTPLHVKRNRSLRRLFPKKASNAPPLSYEAPRTAPIFLSQPQSQHRGDYNREGVVGASPHPAQRSASSDSYHHSGQTHTPVPALHDIRPMPSEAARLRSLHIGQQNPLTHSHPRVYPDVSPTLDNFSRPRKISITHNAQIQEGSPAPTSPSISTNRSPQHTGSPQPPNRKELGRDRGFSTSSTQSRAFSPTIPLRNSLSISDLMPEDRVRNVSRNMTDARKLSPTSAGSLVQLPYRALPGDEVRESLRSVQTTGTSGTSATWQSSTTATTWTNASSSFLEVSGYRRNSVTSQRSSTASLSGRDQIDDFLDMYEDGFASATEDEQEHRPSTVESIQMEPTYGGASSPTKCPQPGNTVNENITKSMPNPDLPHLPEFPAQPIIRDSADIFRAQEDFSDPFAESDKENGYSKPLPKSSLARRPSTRAETFTSEQAFDKGRDRYGFKKESQYISLAAYNAWDAQYSLHLARRRGKWTELMRECGLDHSTPEVFPPRSSKTKRFIRKGIPPDWRGEAWWFYGGGPKRMAKNPGLYQELIDRVARGRLSPTDEELIERDLHRTFPDNILFKPNPGPDSERDAASQGRRGNAKDVETPLLQALRRVLQATALHNPKIGYCQSLNFLAGLLLLFMDEQRAFWMLDLITRVYLPGTHEINLEGSTVDQGVLMMSLREAMPSLWAKIGGDLDGGGTAGDGGPVGMRLPPITVCCTAWFMSCFIGTLPIETTLRVWDAFFYEGSKTLFRIALAIFKVGETDIKAVSDPMEVFQVVQNIPRRLIDANTLMEACFKRRNGFGHLSQNVIDERRAERRKGYKEEREGLRAGTALRPGSRKGTGFLSLTGRKHR